MCHTEAVAIGRYNARDKSYVVIIWPYHKDLALLHLCCTDEVRSFAEVDIGGDVAFSAKE